METKDQKVLDEILKSHGYDPTAVIAIMQDIQKVYRYLPEEMLCKKTASERSESVWGGNFL